MNAFALAGLIMGAAALSGGMAYYSHRLQKKRKEAMALVAHELRFDFSPEGDETLLSSLSSAQLFRHGHTKRITSLMRGTAKGAKAAVFDYAYTIGGGKEKHTYRQTVLCLNPEGQAFPRFCLRPGRVWDKVGAFFGHKDIDFDMHPDFSKKFSLRGEDEHQIQKLFNGGVIAFFEREPGLCMEGETGNLLLYRPRKKLKPEEIRPFLEKGSELLSLLQR